MAGLAEDLGGQAVLDDLALVNDGDAVADLRRLAQAEALAQVVQQHRTEPSRSETAYPVIRTSGSMATARAI